MDHSFYWVLLLCIAIVVFVIGYAIGEIRGATEERIAITGNSLPNYKNPPPPPEINYPEIGFQLSNSSRVFWKNDQTSFAMMKYFDDNTTVIWREKQKKTADRGNSNTDAVKRHAL